MESKVYLRRYRLCVDAIGVPTVLRRSASEGTFKAEDIVSNETVALQIIPAAKLRAAVREQLETDARLATQINHLNVPRLRDFGFEDEQLAYVTDYFAGTTLDQWIQQHGPLPVAPVLRIGSQIISALGAAAFQGVFHPALHPGNIILVPGQTAEGEWPLIKVLNFVGLPPSFSRAESVPGATAEPRDFASPEQLARGAVDFRSEVYSLGCILWFLLRGAPPEAAETVANARGLPAAVRALLASLLAAEPGERPLDPVALQEQFQNCLTQTERGDGGPAKLGLTSPAPAPVSISSETFPLERSRSSVGPLAIAAVLLISAILGGLFWSGYFHRVRSVEKLGVPVGVPEAEPSRSAPEAITENAAPISSPPEEAAATPAITASEPPALVSTADTEAAPTPPAAEPSPESEPAETPAAVTASSDTPAEEPPAIAEISPNESSSPTPEPVLEIATTETPPPPAETEATPEIVAVTPEPIEAVKAEPVRVERSVPASDAPTIADPFGKPLVPVESATNPVAGSQRSRKQLDAPPVARPTPTPNKAQSRRSRHQRQKTEATQDLPVLPALPPD